jgi:hypothetical protein
MEFKDCPTFSFLQYWYAIPCKAVNYRTIGLFPFQVTSEPKMSHFVHMEVVVPQTKILGESDLFVKSGSTVQIKCIITQSLEQPAYIFWFHDGGRVVNLNGKHQWVDRVREYITLLLLYILHNTYLSYQSSSVCFSTTEYFGTGENSVYMFYLYFITKPDKRFYPY